jgi:hypothetical protein
MHPTATSTGPTCWPPCCTLLRASLNGLGKVTQRPARETQMRLQFVQEPATVWVRRHPSSTSLVRMAQLTAASSDKVVYVSVPSYGHTLEREQWRVPHDRVFMGDGMQVRWEHGSWRKCKNTTTAAHCAATPCTTTLPPEASGASEFDRQHAAAVLSQARRAAGAAEPLLHTLQP